MSKGTCMTSLLKCSCGTVPSPLLVQLVNGVTLTKLPAANALDHVPFLNIVPFGMCTSTMNPMVKAASGSPMPCIPVTLFPWNETATKVKIRGIPSVTEKSELKCLWNGSISIEFTSQFMADME